MAVKIRLQRHGRGKRPFYHIVAADSRSPRDGKYIERIGDYNPLTSPASINIDVEKAVDWLEKGAGFTDTIKAILKYKGILYKKHLLRGLRKGALTAEQVETKYAEWVDAHKNKVLDHQKKHHASKAERSAQMIEAEQKKAADRDAKRAAALEAAKAANAPATEETAVEATENTAPAAEGNDTPAES